MKNIYFVGKAGSGKTSACNFIIQKYGFYAVKFAAPMYDLANRYIDMKRKDRNLLQILGTDVGRMLVNKDIWTNRLLEDIYMIDETRKRLNMSQISYVLDDCRFSNEHKNLKNQGWIGIFLDTLDDVRIKRLSGRDGNVDIELLNHKSETEIDLFKHDLLSVNANGTIDEMNNEIDKIVKEIK